MPNRLFSILIVVFWLTMMVWLMVREGFVGGAESVNLRDSLAPDVDSGPTRWLITQDGRTRGRATTQVTINEHGQYELMQNVQLDPLDGVVLFPEQRLICAMRVNPDGQLHRYQLDVRIGADSPLRWTVEGYPKAGALSCKVDGPLINDEYQMPYDGKGLIFSSLCPFDRIEGIRYGQRWEVLMIDPIESSLSRLVDSPPVQVRVLDRPEGLKWGNQKASCYVLDVQQPGVEVRIWVRQLDFLVLRQKVVRGNSEMVFTREFRKSKRFAVPGK